MNVGKEKKKKKKEIWVGEAFNSTMYHYRIFILSFSWHVKHLREFTGFFSKTKGTLFSSFSMSAYQI